MKIYLLIGVTNNGSPVYPHEGISNPEESMRTIKNFINNDVLKSAILIETTDENTEVQLLKGDIMDFSEALDKEMPDWQKTDDLVKLSA